MLKKILIRTLTLSAVVGLVSASALADDKAFNGGACYQTSGTGLLAHDLSGTVYNDSTTGTLDIDCPIVRDNPGGTIAAGQVSFDVFDRSGTSDVGCWFISENGTTTGLAVAEADGAVSTGVNQAGVKNMPTTTSNVGFGATTFSHVRCVLPAKVGTSLSHLARIWMNEP